MDLRGKVIVISGANGGIGKVLTGELEKEGVVIVPLGRKEADFTKLSDLLKAVDVINSDVPKIDALINLAGVGIYKPIEDITTKDWETSFSVNVTAPYFLTKKLLHKLSESHLSLVLSIGSGMATIPTGGRSAYCASKAALRVAMLSLADEFNGAKPHFSVVTLGSVLTSFGPLSLEDKKREQLEGKAYFTPEWVAKKLVEIVKTEKRETEYTFYPTDYIKGTWWKPS